MSVQQFTTQNFSSAVLSSDKPVLVDFWAAWCGPCRMQAPVLDEAEKELGDLGTIGKVNVDEEGALAERYGVASIPTLILFKNGEVAEKAVGVTNKEAILKMFGKQQ